MNNLHCSDVSESGAVAEMVFGLVFLSLVSLAYDAETVGVKVLLGGVPDFSMGLSLFSRGERFRLLSWLSLSGFLLLPFVMLFSERDVVVVVGAGGGDRRLEDSDRFDLVSEDRFLNRLVGGVRERDVDLDLE